MRRGDVVTVSLDSVAPPGEAAKARPAIIVSNSTHAARVAIQGRGTVIVVPISSNVSRVFPFQLSLHDPDAMEAMGLTEPSKAQVEQLSSVAFTRITEIRGRTPNRLAWHLDELIKVHLALT